MQKISAAVVSLLSVWCVATAFAEPPVVTYIFPAGGQRGTDVQFRVGGLFLHEGCPFEIRGVGVTASPRIQRTETLWFEGPVIPMPESQAAEDYPKDLAGQVKIAADAPLGARTWQVWTSQGATTARAFVIGNLPEVIEQEVEGAPVAVPVKLPLTINGRMFPREDVDLWSFEARAGEQVTCTVLTTKLGSPFDARLTILDAEGQELAESAEAFGSDAFVRFTPPANGTYTVRIHDVKFGGLQHYVYRLTLTTGPQVDYAYPLGGRRGTVLKAQLYGAGVPAQPVEVTLPSEGTRYRQTIPVGATETNVVSFVVDDLPEVLEAEPNDSAEQARAVEMSSVLNGRIDRPGDVDTWSFQGKKGTVVEFDLWASRLGSPVDSMLSVTDATGKELAKADDISPLAVDSQLKFTPPEDGVYRISVSDRFPSRGGSQFAYRMRAVTTTSPDFRLQLTADSLILNRGTDGRLKVRVERLGGFEGEIKLDLAPLPAGVTANNTSIAANANEVDVVLKSEATTPIKAARLQVQGTAKIGEASVTRSATMRLPFVDEPEIDSMLVAVALPTPFKVKGIYDVQYAQRGSLYTCHYRLERGTYEGPLVVCLADKQMRHLQGVSGPTITVPAGATEFDYTVFLPPWMEVGRTSRTCIMVSAVLDEPDGSKHNVSFSSVNQNEQIVALIDPGQLNVEPDHRSVTAAPGAYASVPLRVSRGPGLRGDVTVELITPRHMSGIRAETLTIAADQSRATLTVKFAQGTVGPLNMPVLIRATTKNDDGKPVVAEASLEIVPQK